LAKFSYAFGTQLYVIPVGSVSPSKIECSVGAAVGAGVGGSKYQTLPYGPGLAAVFVPVFQYKAPVQYAMAHPGPTFALFIAVTDPIVSPLGP
jgi:hypothetical protein